MFESCAQLFRLFYAFRAGEVSPDEFRHRQHLAIALCYVSLMPLEEAARAFRADLLRLVAPLGLTRKYHETITRFWLAVAAHYLEAHADDRCLASVACAFVELFGDKTLIERHYSLALLSSAEARATWIEPDLAPIFEQTV